MANRTIRKLKRHISRGSVCLLLATTGAIAQPTAGVTLAPFKDKFFAYQKVLGGNADGSYLDVEYDEFRDVNGRDEMPVRRAHSWFVDTSVRWHEVQKTVALEGRRIDIDQTGTLDGAKFVVIFLHGRGGDRSLGSDDWTFGGNFNRIKNLAWRNKGAYIAPTVKSYGADGAADIAALIGHAAAAAPNAPIVLACGSMGSYVCWKLTENKAIAPHLAGMIILGGPSDPDFMGSAAYAAGMPLLLSQGTKDEAYSWQKQKAVFEAIRQKNPAYPVRFVLFQNGKHGTPIRMIDWRTALNWVFAESASR